MAAGLQPPTQVLWEYVGITPDWDSLLTARTANVLRDLRRKPLTSYGIATDTRAVHKKLFAGLAPPGLSHLAGNYRGESLPGLLDCTVTIDGMQGTEPHLVAGALAKLRSTVEAGMREFDGRRGKEHELDFVDDLVTFACAVFCDFLAIHPYANGNGHAARFIAWALFGRYEYWPATWTVHPRLKDPEYTELIRAYRRGETDKLKLFMLQDLRRSDGTVVVVAPLPLSPSVVPVQQVQQAGPAAPPKTTP